MIVPLLLVAGGVAGALYLLSSGGEERAVPETPPELPPGAFPTRWRGVNAIFEDLKRAAAASGLPLGLLVGWVAKESAGRVGAAPKRRLKGEDDVERGFFQLSPSESRSLGIDHARLSTDPAYSIAAGVRLIREKYVPRAEKLGVAPAGSSYFWRLVKLGHTMGSGATRKIVEGAREAGAAGSWERLRAHAIENEKRYFSLVKHSPSKWFPLVDDVYEVGRPFGFGDAYVAVGAAAFDDIPDPLDVIQPRT